MEFFLDTADVDEIREIAAWGILDGVTTNPSLIKKSGRDFKEVVREIAGICSGPISAEVTAMDTQGMLEQARSSLNKKREILGNKSKGERFFPIYNPRFYFENSLRSEERSTFLYVLICLKSKIRIHYLKVDIPINNVING